MHAGLAGVKQSVHVRRLPRLNDPWLCPLPVLGPVFMNARNHEATSSRNPWLRSERRLETSESLNPKPFLNGTLARNNLPACWGRTRSSHSFSASSNEEWKNSEFSRLSTYEGVPGTQNCTERPSIACLKVSINPVTPVRPSKFAQTIFPLFLQCLFMRLTPASALKWKAPKP